MTRILSTSTPKFPEPPTPAPRPGPSNNAGLGWFGLLSKTEPDGHDDDRWLCLETDDPEPPVLMDDRIL